MKTKLKFIPLSYEPFDWEGRNYILIYGRDEKNKQVAVIDSFSPYLYTILKEDITEKQIENLKDKIKKIKIINERRTTKVEEIELENKKFLGKDVKALKIFITNYKDAHDVADNLNLEGIDKRREYDINIITKYIIDKKLLPLQEYEVEGELLNNSQEFGSIDSSLEVSQVIKAEKFTKIQEKEFKPKVLAFDIETEEFEIGKGEILMISLYSDTLKKVLTHKKCSSSQNFVECFKDEAEMLEAFIKYVKSEAPDVLAGYFSDGFDLQYLRARAEKNNIKLNLGLDNSQPSFTRGNVSTGKISGLIHIDLFRFIEANYAQYLQSETLGLGDVSKELLGEDKGEFEKKKTPSKIKEHEWKDYFSYNLQDSILVFKLFEKFWPDLSVLSKTLQEPIFNVSRDRTAQHIEDYILHNLDKFSEIAEKRPIHDEIGTRRARERNEGAFVLQPTPGLYENLAMFDFTSMHTSIIISFNISGATLLNKKEKDCYESPELEIDGEKKKLYFTKEPGCIPLLMKEIMSLRKKYKAEYKKNPSPITKARSNAFKVLSAAIHGYLGFFGARYYSLESAAATLAFVRQFNKETIEKCRNKGFNVIFSDTDSVAFTLNNKSKEEVLEFLKELNEQLPGVMELELEDFYKRGIWVTKRTGEFGAKKKYALIDEKNKLKIRGFETVRRDWCDLARELQSKILELILKEGNGQKALELVKKTIKDLKERKITREQVTITTQLKKPLSEYKSITPHVIAARKMQEAGIPLNVGMTLKYFIAETREKKALVREKVKLEDEKGEYNLDYYLNNQLIPAVENIFDVFNIDIKEITQESRQKKLF